MNFKQGMLGAVRKFHLRFADRGLPAKIAIYLHALEPVEFGVFRCLADGFREMGYSFCTPEEFLLPENGKTIFLSFDDNYSSWYLALPELERLGVKATFYVNTLPFRDQATPAVVSRYFERIHYEGALPTLSRNETKELHVAGHTVACHSHSHYILSKLHFPEACAEISTSKRILEEILGEPVQHFSYPYGMRRHFTRRLEQYCIDIGFQTVASARPGLQHHNVENRHIHRTLWRVDRPFEENLSNLRVDGAVFELLTGRSAIG